MIRQGFWEVEQRTKANRPSGPWPEARAKNTFVFRFLARTTKIVGAHRP